MNKKFLMLFAAVLLTASFVYVSNVKADTVYPLEGHSVVLDAGHGGDDPGSTACSVLEKDANYNIAYRLKEKLEENGAAVYLTRDQNYDGVDDLANGGTYDNEDRYTFANLVGAEVLISIHLNGSTDPTVNGSMNLYSKPKKDKEFASVIHVGMASYLDQQVDWAVPDLGITNFMSGVTLRFNGPAVLTEPIFISNTEECVALKAGSRQGDIVNVLYNGLLRWFGNDFEPLVFGKK